MPSDQPGRPMNSGNHLRIPPVAATADLAPGAIVRRVRQARGLTLAELGARAGYSASQVSRFERGLAPMTDITVLRRFADALAISPRPSASPHSRPATISDTATRSARRARALAFPHLGCRQAPMGGW